MDGQGRQGLKARSFKERQSEARRTRAAAVNTDPCKLAQLRAERLAKIQASGREPRVYQPESTTGSPLTELQAA